ncbi:phosphatidate phosphatase LPIN3 isoform X3 [Pleurodeles waltl]|uniref:phosphatidate phosphatase LPIN3 isoform X3 n=1 Tax=Pleurodeles waltl TaxID=8319 RepID=UPI003709A47A
MQASAGEKTIMLGERKDVTGKEGRLASRFRCVDLRESNSVRLSPSFWSQTMNYVGQLAETVFVTVKELYRGLNPATLSGCIDVLVVRQADGTFQCSPFHVRFGKLGVLRSKEKVVDIEINGEPVDLHMKLGDNGEAFFVRETETCEESVPSHLCTSPLPLENNDDEEPAPGPGDPTSAFVTPQISPIQDPALANNDTSLRKKRRRRKKLKMKESIRSEEAELSSPEEGMEDELTQEENHRLLSARDSIYYSFAEVSSDEEPPPTQSKDKDCYPFSGEEWILPQSRTPNRPSSPKSDSELEIKAPDLSPRGAESHMQWNWGRLPQVSKSERTDPPISARNSPVITMSALDTSVSILSPTSTSITSIQLSESTHFHAITDDSSEPNSQTDSPESISPSLLCRPEPRFMDRTSLHLQHEENPPPDVVDGSTQGSCLTPEEDQREEMLEAVATAGTGKDEKVHETLKLVFHIEEPHQQEGQPANRTEKVEDCKPVEDNTFVGLKPEQQTKKGHLKRSQHLGPSDIYLDDISKLTSDEIAIYFPQSDGGPPNKPGTETGCVTQDQFASTSPNDSGTENFSDPSGDQMDGIALSLCGGLGEKREISHEKFMQHALTFSTFTDNPGILEDPNLVIRIHKKYYNWAVAAPMILSLQAFRMNLPKITIDKLVKEKMPRKTGRWWFSWRRKDFTVEERQSMAEKNEAAGFKAEAPEQRDSEYKSASEDESTQLDGQTKEQPVFRQPVEHAFPLTYKKSLRLSSEQISCLNLRDGANDAVFSVTTQYQGTCRCSATIYLWNWDDKVVISDIDGTITKSDALGHILPQLGKDWTHQGIAKLYNKIHLNGYKFLYCSARAIGMANITKGYLQWVNDRGCALPMGPVLLAPSSLFSALHREVIEKKPEVFKIACLTDIRNLFNPQRQPFYAAFGNRTNDVYAYKEVGLPESRIFTVNPKGELIQELTKTTKSSYARLSELVELIFPPISQETPSALLCPEFSNFAYWRESVSSITLDDLAEI